MSLRNHLDQVRQLEQRIEKARQIIQEALKQPIEGEKLKQVLQALEGK